MSRTPLTAQAVADLVGGRLLGNGAVLLRRVSTLEQAGADALAVLSAAEYLPAFRTSQAGAVLVAERFASEPAGPATRIVVADAAAALARAAEALHPEPPVAPGVDATARIGPGAVLGADVVIGPYVVIGAEAVIGARTRLGPGAVVDGGAVIGEDCRIGPRAVVAAGARLGNRVVLEAGAVVGDTGFGYASGRGGHRRIPHVGLCILEDDVEVGVNSAIDRGKLGDTVIGRGTKIDNLVQIGHNCRIGSHVFVAAMTGIAGSVTVGDWAVIGGAVGIADHVTIGPRAAIAAKSGVFGDVPAGETWGGYPARPHRQFLRAMAELYRNRERPRGGARGGEGGA